MPHPLALQMNDNIYIFDYDIVMILINYYSFYLQNHTQDAAYSTIIHHYNLLIYSQIKCDTYDERHDGPT
jgi:hypothetical protein